MCSLNSKGSRFFKDKDFERFIELTEDEIKILIKFEIAVLNTEGLGNISGGFVDVELQEIDEENDVVIHGIVKSGIQDGDENSLYTDEIIFNRKELTVEYF